MAAQTCTKKTTARRQAVDYEFFLEDLKLFGHAVAARQLAHAHGDRQKTEQMEDTAVELGFDLLENILCHASEEQYERMENQIRALPLLS